MGGYCHVPGRMAQGVSYRISRISSFSRILGSPARAARIPVERGGRARGYWALTAAIRFARPCLASAKYIPVFGFT